MNKKYVAMRPARLGSQRIPKKNIRFLGGKPLIKYPIDFCLECDFFDSIWVNTESEELGKAIETEKVHFHRRPPELASNTATNRDFTYQFLKVHDCDYVVMVNPTSPLLRVETLKNFVEYVDENDFDVVFSVVSEKTECFCEGKPVNFSRKEKINSQFLTPVDRIAWAITAWKRDSFIKMQESGVNPIFGGEIGLFSIPKDESCDLDTLEDWNIAEGMIVARNNKNTDNARYMDLG